MPSARSPRGARSSGRGLGRGRSTLGSRGIESYFSYINSLSPIAWYRFNTGITITGQGASSWANWSGAGGAFLQATDGARPVQQGNGSLLCNGTDEFMSATFTLVQPYTVYGLVNAVTWTSTDRIISSSTTFLSQVIGTPQLALNAGTPLSSISPVLNTVNVIAIVGNSTSSVLQLNNGAPVTGDAGTGAFSNPFLGSSIASTLFGNIDNYEWMFFPTAHSADVRAQIIRYLATVGSLSI